MDPTWIAAAKEFGFPIVLCAVLLLAIRWQNAALVKAYTDRIRALEGLVLVLTTKVDQLEQDRIKRADDYASTLKSIALAWSAATRETNEITRNVLSVLRKLCESTATMAENLGSPSGQHPVRRPVTPVPHHSEVPRDPAQPTTDRTSRDHNHA